MSARTVAIPMLLFALSCAAGVTFAQSDATPVVRFGFVIDGPWSGNADVAAIFQKEISEILEGEFKPEFPPDKTITGDWTLESVRGAIDRLMSDRDVDFVITLGVLASHVAATRGPAPKPTIAPTIIDAGLQQLPGSNGTSGVRNLNYLAFPHSVADDINTFLEIVEFKKLAVVTNAYTARALPEIRPRSAALARSLGVETVFVDVEQSAADAMRQLPADVEAVYVAPLLHIPEAEFEALADSLIARRLPSFSLFGRRDVELGLLASANTNVFPRLSRRVAINVQRILLGEDAGSLPTAFEPEEQLVINMATARAINVYPNWGVLTEAELINETRTSVERVLSLESAIDEALKVNLDLIVRHHEVQAGAQSVRVARSPLLPEVALNLLGLQIDGDRAERSFGQQSETTLSGRAVLRQPIYADRMWTGYTTEKRLQEGREFDLRTVQLDIAQEAGEAYLNVLRASTFEDIQKKNLERTRTNLSLARVRESIGAANPNEVLRWESQIANNRIDVINANAGRNLSEIQLNRVLNRPVEEAFLTEETDIGDPSLFLYRGDLIEYLDNPWEFKVLRAFLVQYGLGVAPEIKTLGAAIAAQERVLTNTGREFWVPSFFFTADAEYIFLREGAGSDGGPLGTPKDYNWTVALSADYALFRGGQKLAARGEATEQLIALRTELESTRLRIEQRIRSAAHIAGASYASITQANLSAEAAGKTLDLVEDQYGLGAANIITLLDAQNNSLIADLTAATAVYTFMIDLLELERAIGKLALQMTDEERADFVRQLDDYFAKARQNGID